MPLIGARRAVILGHGTRRVTLPQNLILESGTLLEGFEAATDWSLVNGAAENDAVNFVSGTQSVKMTSNSGVAASMTKVINTTFTTAPDHVRLSCYVPTYAEKPTGITLYLSSSTTLTKSFNKALSDPVFAGWNTLHVRLADWTNTGGDDWANAMVRLRVRGGASAGVATVVSSDRLVRDMTTQGAVMLTFDDGLTSVYEKAFGYMKRFHIRGTTYPIGNTIGGAGKATAGQLLEMYDAGWTVGNHTNTHANLTTLSEADQEAEFTAGKAAVDAIGCTTTSGHVCYPYGATDANTYLAMVATGMLTGRTLVDRYNVTPTTAWHGLYCYDILNTDTATTINARIDAAVARGDVQCLAFHDILDSAGAGTLYSDFMGVIDHIVSAGIYAITVDDFYRLASGPVTIPLPS